MKCYLLLITALFFFCVGAQGANAQTLSRWDSARPILSDDALTSEKSESIHKADVGQDETPVESDFLLTGDGILLCPLDMPGDAVLDFDSIQQPDFGSVEFDRQGSLVYHPWSVNEELDDPFVIYAYDMQDEVVAIEGTFSPLVGQLSFAILASPPQGNRVMIAGDNGQVETYDLNREGLATVIQALQNRIDGGVIVLGGAICFNGQKTYFGSDPVVEMFEMLNPGAIAQLDSENARRARAQNTSVFGLVFGNAGSGLTIQEREILFELGLIGVDIGGIFDPTPISDGVAATMELSQGNFVYASINVVSMIPWVGDLAKTGKLPRLLRIVEDAIAHAAKNADFAQRIRPLIESLSTALGRVPLDGLPASVRDTISTLQKQTDDFLRVPKRIPACEKQVKSMAKRIEKELGKDARREFHDLKDKALGDRTMQEALDDAVSLFEDAGKEVPPWLRDRLR